MIAEISKDKWNEFFSILCRTLEGWDTKVEVLNPEIGVQILSSGLPFSGVTLEKNDGQTRIELSLGADKESHITHTVDQPAKVAYEAGSIMESAVLDIEDLTGAKTLITFTQPFPMAIEREKTEIARAG